MTTTTGSAAPTTSLPKVLPGLLLALLLAMLDSTIVSTALPTIAGDLGGFGSLPWVVVAYLLTSTVTTPLWGKLADMFGRKHLLQLAIGIFVAGSIGSGLANSIGMLIGFRALQGVGAGGLWVGVMSVIGVLAPPKERGKYQSYIAALSAVATVCGPLVGGLFADHGIWRAAFYVNVPIGAISFAVVALNLHMPRTSVTRRFDYAGAVLIGAATVAIVLGTNWGGDQYAWASPVIIGLGVLALLAIIAFVAVERRAAEPIFPPRLFAKRNFTLSLVLGLIVGVALYSSLTFLPIYQQSVHNFSATSSGLLLLPLLGGMLVGSTWSGPVMSRTGAYRAILGAGSVALAIGAALLSLLSGSTSTWQCSIYMVVLGFGLGLVFQNVMVVTQNSSELKDIGMSSGALTYFRNVGGSLGVSAFAAVFGHRLDSYLNSRLDGPTRKVLTSHGGRLDNDTIGRLPSATRGVYSDGVASAVHLGFLASIPLFVIAVVVSLALSTAKKQQEPAASPKLEQSPKPEPANPTSASVSANARR